MTGALGSIPTAAWLAGGYALVLLLVAHGIDRLARRAHRAHDARQAPGFVFHEDHDAWLCPQDQWLWPRSFDPDNRVMRYRGSPSVCNACPVKATCTTSDDGREVGRAVDPWPASESARFHRGIACGVAVLAVVFPLVTAATLEDPRGRLGLFVLAALVAAGGLPLWSHLRRTAVDPDGVLFRSLDENLAERALDAEALRRRRTVYAADRRDAPVPLALGRTRYASDRQDVDPHA